MTAPFVIVTVWCGQCAAERGSDSSRLGRLERVDGGVVRWVSVAPRRERLNPSRDELAERARTGQPDAGNRRWRGWRAGVVLSHPEFPDLDVPDELEAICDRHGVGRVSKADVVGKSGNIVVKFSATA